MNLFCSCTSLSVLAYYKSTSTKLFCLVLFVAEIPPSITRSHGYKSNQWQVNDATATLSK